MLLLRDYGRLDLKHLKFAGVPGSRLPSPVAGWDWHTRGDGPARELARGLRGGDPARDPGLTPA